MGRSRAILIAALLGVASATPAFSEPRNVRVQAFDAATCSDSDCSGSAPLTRGSGFAGTLRLKVHAEDPFGLRRVRVEAHPVNDSKWYCVAEEDVRNSGTTVDVTFDWNTRLWPSPESGSGCTHTLPHIHGTPTPNASMELRAVAVNLVDDQQQGRSDAFAFSLRNEPEVVSWESDPAFDSTSRNVVLSWVPGLEPDLIEYRVTRVSPSGGEKLIRIDAHSPESDGCSRVAEQAIRCSDQLPEAGGEYSYTVVALRPGGQSLCGSKKQCLPSPASQTRTVAAAPKASSTTTPVTSPTETQSVSPTQDPTRPGPVLDPADPVTAAPDQQPAADSSSGLPIGLLVLGVLSAAAITIGVRLQLARNKA